MGLECGLRRCSQQGRVAKGDVLKYRRGIADKVLEHCGRFTPPGLGIERGQVPTVHKDSPLSGSVETEEQAHERRLARAVLAHERDPLTGPDLQVDVGERRSFRPWIREADVAELNPFTEGSLYWLPVLRRIRRFRFKGEEVAQDTARIAAPRRCCASPIGDVVGEVAEPGEAIQQRDQTAQSDIVRPKAISRANTMMKATASCAATLPSPGSATLRWAADNLHEKALEDAYGGGGAGSLRDRKAGSRV